MTETGQPPLDLLDWTAVAAVVISLVALWRTGRERTLCLLSDAHRQAVAIELTVTKEVVDQIGTPVGYWAERVEEKYTEARRIYARTRRHLKRADRQGLGRRLQEIDRLTKQIDREVERNDDATDFASLLDRRAFKHSNFVWGLSRALDRASHAGIKIENLPPEDSN